MFTLFLIWGVIGLIGLMIWEYFSEYDIEEFSDEYKLYILLLSGPIVWLLVLILSVFWLLDL